MPLPFRFPLRFALPLCLGFGTVLSVSAKASISPARMAAVETRILPLSHADPKSILKMMHWDQGKDLPGGVSRIQALPQENALSVVATPDGFAGLQELVKLLDFAPRQVQIKFALARATAADLQASGFHSFALVPVTSPSAGPTAPSAFLGMASGSTAVQLLQTLRRRKSVLQSPILVTTNNQDAALSLSGGGTLPGWKTITFAVTPRVNSDNSITLRLNPAISKRVPGAVYSGNLPITTTQEIQTSRTVKNGETLVLIDLFPQAAGAKGGNLYLFVTPTILPEKRSAPAKRAK